MYVVITCFMKVESSPEAARRMKIFRLPSWLAHASARFITRLANFRACIASLRIAQPVCSFMDVCRHVLEVQVEQMPGVPAAVRHVDGQFDGEEGGHRIAFLPSKKVRPTCLFRRCFSRYVLGNGQSSFYDSITLRKDGTA